jgi:hypothetical protein
MSGGHFNYDQYKMGYIAESIQDIIENNRVPINKKDRDPWDSREFYYDYPEEIIERFKLGVHYLKIAQVYAQRIDWLVSGDDGEESFMRRLDEDLKKIINSDK